MAAPGGTDWEGTAKEAAWNRVTVDSNFVGRQGDAGRAAADIAANGAADLRAAQRAALEAIADAEADGFKVAEDLSLTDTRRVDVLTMAARYTAAAEHAEYIRWNAEKLLATDTLIGDRLSAKASELTGISFDGETEGRDGSIQLVDNDKSTREEIAEPRNPVPEPGTWPPPGTPVSGGTPGGEPYPGGLGPPVPGESLPERPKPPAWESKDIGAGGDATFGKWEPRLPGDQLDKWGIDAARETMGLTWPNAARNMEHYFGVSGTPLEQNVGQMLAEIPVFQQTVDGAMQRLGAQAISQAQASGASGPITFPVNTAWDGVAIPSDQRDWYLALGNFDHNLTGEVTVYPPAAPGGQWTYALDADVNMRDRYNWDVAKATPIAGMPITDSQFARFHLIGWAKEFTMTGSTGVHSGS